MANLNITLLSKLPTDELIRQLELACSASPIISLLCDRLSQIDASTINIGVKYSATCPICLTDHEIVVEDENNCRLEVAK